MNSTQTLTAHREQKSTYSCITTLKNENGFVVAILTGYNQPKKSQKTIVVKEKMFNLKFQ